MLTPRDIDRLVWDDWNREHITKHGVTPGEVEEVVRSGFSSRPSYKGRYLVTGRTSGGRTLSVALGASPDDPRAFYVFSARPASRIERRELEDHES